MAYSKEQLRALKKKGVTVHISGLFQVGVDCPGAFPCARSDACEENGCVGTEGLKALQGVPLPCNPGFFGSTMGMMQYFH